MKRKIYKHGYVYKKKERKSFSLSGADRLKGKISLHKFLLYLLFSEIHRRYKLRYILLCKDSTLVTHY